MANQIHAFLGTACAALLCAGCAGITVSKAPSLDSNTQMQGTPWNLAMTRFTVTITRHITKCGPEIKGKVETLASASTAPDEDQRYLLKSNGWFSTSDIKSTVSSQGINTALNAETADATPTVIGNVIGTAAQVAIGFAAAGANGGKPTGPAQICTTKLQTAVDTLYPSGQPSLKKTVDEATAALAQRTADVAVLTAQVATDKSDKSIKAKLVQALSDQQTAKQDLMQKQDAFDGALKLSTKIQTITWPHRSTEFRSDKFSIEPEVLDDWIIAGVDGPNAIKQLDVYLALYTQPEADGWNIPSALPAADLKLGLPVRLSRTAKIVTCTGAPCPEKFAAGQVLAKNQTATDFAVLQVGPTYALPIAGGLFRSESANVTLDPNGIPSVLQTTHKVAAASALTGATKDAATQLAALPAALRVAELTKTKSEVDQINADIALRTAQQTAGLQGETGTLTARTGLINAQTANSAAQQNASIQDLQQQAGSMTTQASVLQAQAALAIAQANSQVVDQTSTLGAQTSLINAQTALLNATFAQVKAQTATLP
jgi:hypothetical protein